MVCATTAAIISIFLHTLPAFLQFPKVYTLCKSEALHSLLHKVSISDYYSLRRFSYWCCYVSYQKVLSMHYQSIPFSTGALSMLCMFSAAESLMQIWCSKIFFVQVLHWMCLQNMHWYFTSALLPLSLLKMFAPKTNPEYALKKLMQRETFETISYGSNACGILIFCSGTLQM